MKYTPAEKLFQQSPFSIEKNERLREPQRNAWRATRLHFQRDRTPAILQLPVGCGKTGLMAILPFGIAAGRVLLIAPNTTIREGLATAVDTTSDKCFWRETGVLQTLREGPFAAVLDGPDANWHDCEHSHLVVANIQQMVAAGDRWLSRFPSEFFDMILIDEGHHNAAASWRRVIEHFDHAKVISLTATPFRSDGQELIGQLIYQYTFTRAMARGYIKRLHSVSVAPEEIHFTYRGDDRQHSLDEVLTLREEQWFRKGVALADTCNRHIVQASIQECIRLRQTRGTCHQIIAAACSVDHAERIEQLYARQGWKVPQIHSRQSPTQRRRILVDLRAMRIDGVAQVQMLGEGFDHPLLSVAAVFRPFGSLAPFVQFAGRILRVIRQERAGDADHQGMIVGHAGLNNDQHWEDFRELDQRDQLLFRQLVRCRDEEPGRASQGPSDGPRRFLCHMHVASEILGEYMLGKYAELEPVEFGEVAVDNMLPSEGERISAEQTALWPDAAPAEGPQQRRRRLRNRLNERAKARVQDILNEMRLCNIGPQVGRLFWEARGRDNYVAVNQLLYQRLYARMGIKKGCRSRDFALEQTEQALKVIDLVAADVCDEIRKRMKLRRGYGTG
jgi:DNA repair protein RadD